MMKINKNMIIALAITFCFIAAMFMVIPIRSQSSGSYDPWLDINDDGKISMDEIVASTTAFGAIGDPTKPVVINDNWTEANFSKPINPSTDWTFYNVTAGFKEVTISFSAFVVVGTLTYNIYVGFYRAGLTNQVDSFTDTAVALPVTHYPPSFSSCTTRTYEITGSQMVICIYNPAPPMGLQITAYVSIFMTA